MKSIYLLSFILVLASANLGIDLSNYPFPPLLSLSCLSSQGTSLLMFEIYDDQGSIRKDFLMNYLAAKGANIQNVDAVIRVNDAFAPKDVCNAVAHALPGQFNGKVWLDVANKQNRWSLSMPERIPYLENLIKSCQNHGLKAGVYSNTEDWNNVMGSLKAGSDILRAVPLWYANPDIYAQDNFEDWSYVGFGTWETPTMKTYQVNAYLCNAYTWSMNYYEA